MKRGMKELGAKVYKMCLRSQACMGPDTHLECIEAGEEVVRHSDYEIALKRILELEQELELMKAVRPSQQEIDELELENKRLSGDLGVRGWF